MYDGPGGNDPFTGKIDQKGVLTHGHLPENDNHGGKATTTYADARDAGSGPLATTIDIGSFEYAGGDLAAKGKVPTVTEGQQITFDNFDAGDQNVWHSITACKAPCTASTGIAYPLADADVQFDSGQLGNYGPPTSGSTTWSTPADLTPGTYTYFCRVHPFMRGAFRVVPPASSAPK
jgi:plastocyanin